MFLTSFGVRFMLWMFVVWNNPAFTISLSSWLVTVNPQFGSHTNFFRFDTMLVTFAILGGGF